MLEVHIITIIPRKFKENMHKTSVSHTFRMIIEKIYTQFHGSYKNRNWSS